MRENLNADDLIIVPEIYKDRIQRKFQGTVTSTISGIGIDELSKFGRLIWASQRIDRSAAIARHFYTAGKEVVVLPNTGPARVWMHDEVKEKF